jgi:hypothetical protein
MLGGERFANALRPPLGYRRAMRSVVLATMAIWSVACGTSDSGGTKDSGPTTDTAEISDTGTGSVTGTIHGQTFMIADAVSTVRAAGASTYGAIMMSTVAGICDAARSNAIRASSKLIVISLANASGNRATAPTSAGTYEISSTMMGAFAGLIVVANDSACNPVVASSAEATSGSVTLVSVDGNVFSGNFDVVLDSGDHVTGTFEPGACPAIAQGTGEISCQ